MSTMTLEQVRDYLRDDAASPASERGFSAQELTEMADAIDAHITQPAQAVDVGAAAKRLGDYLFREHALLFSHPALCKALDHALAGSPSENFIKELVRVKSKLTAALPKDSNGAEGV